jgi:MSHA biogenesis protein MshO
LSPQQKLMVRPHSGAVDAGRSRRRGFSLVELIVVIVISGIMAAAVGAFISGPIQGFFDQARRAELVDAAELSLLRLARDLRAALPNSVRINGGALELLLTRDGERYRAEGPGTPADVLDLAAADASFNTFAPLSPPSPLVTPYARTGYLAVYPLMQPGANPYVAADGVMSAAGTFGIDDVENPPGSGRTEYQVTLPAAHRFPFDPPTRRVFLVQGPVTWLCAGGELRRYDGYPVSALQPVPPAGPLVNATVVARNVENCAFRYSAGTAERNAVVSAGIVLAEAGERIRLLRQVHLDNTP